MQTLWSLLSLTTLAMLGSGRAGVLSTNLPMEPRVLCPGLLWLQPQVLASSPETPESLICCLLASYHSLSQISSRFPGCPASVSQSVRVIGMTKAPCPVVNVLSYSWHKTPKRGFMAILISQNFMLFLRTGIPRRHLSALVDSQ